jgi:hypothetical protein
MDVKSALLHKDLIEKIYMEQPPIFVQDNNFLCILKKYLCGLKQTPMHGIRRLISSFYVLVSSIVNKTIIFMYI